MKAKGKYEVINRLLHDEYVIVQINPACSGVILPEHLSKEPAVSLKLSKLFSGGMEITPDKIIANLSFNQKYFSCTIPLDSIWSATSVKNETTIWPESTPIEILKSASVKQEAVKSPAKETDSKQPAAKKPFLKRIK